MREMPGNVYSPGRMFALLDVKRRTTRNRERKREREREREGGGWLVDKEAKASGDQ